MSAGSNHANTLTTEDRRAGRYLVNYGDSQATIHRPGSCIDSNQAGATVSRQGAIASVLDSTSGLIPCGKCCHELLGKGHELTGDLARGGGGGGE